MQELSVAVSDDSYADFVITNSFELQPIAKPRESVACVWKPVENCGFAVPEEREFDLVALRWDTRSSAWVHIVKAL